MNDDNRNETFKVGDHVAVKCGNLSERSLCGVIVTFDSDSDEPFDLIWGVGVDLSAYKGLIDYLHTCNGFLDRGCGYWLSPHHLTHIPPKKENNEP